MNAAFVGEFSVGIDIDPYDGERGMRRGQLCDHGLEGPARRAPLGPKVDEDQAILPDRPAAGGPVGVEQVLLGAYRVAPYASAGCAAASGYSRPFGYLLSSVLSSVIVMLNLLPKLKMLQPNTSSTISSSVNSPRS